MTKISTSTRRTVKKLGIEKGIEVLAAAGYDALDLSLDLYTEQIGNGDWRDTAKAYRALAEKHGITYNQAHAPFGGGQLPDGRSNYAVNLSPLMPAALEMAAAAGVETVVIHPMNFLEIGYLGNEELHFERNMEFYTKLTPIARDLGVKIAIENLWNTNRLTGNIGAATCSDPVEHIRYIDTLAAPDVYTLCLDLGHSALVGRTPETVIRTLGHDRLGALHVHDVDYKKDLHTLPYQSKLDWEEICRALGEINYKGVLTLEADSFIAGVDVELLPASVRYMAATARHLAKKIDSYR